MKEFLLEHYLDSARLKQILYLMNTTLTYENLNRYTIYWPPSWLITAQTDTIFTGHHLYSSRLKQILYWLEQSSWLMKTQTDWYSIYWTPYWLMKTQTYTRFTEHHLGSSRLHYLLNTILTHKGSNKYIWFSMSFLYVCVVLIIVNKLLFKPNKYSIYWTPSWLMKT